MALTTKSVNPLTHFDQSYYNNLKRNVSMKEAESYRLRVTKQRPKAIDLWQPWAFKKVSEKQIRGYEEQNEIAKKQQEEIAKDVATGKVIDFGSDPAQTSDRVDPDANPNDEDAHQQAEQAFINQQAQEEGDVDPTHDEIGTQDPTQEDLGQKWDNQDSKDNEDNDPEIENEDAPQATAEDLGEAPDEEELQGTVENPIDLGAGDLVGAEKQEEVTEEITRDEVLKLLRANGFRVPWNIRYDTAVKKAVDAWLL